MIDGLMLLVLSKEEGNSTQDNELDNSLRSHDNVKKMIMTENLHNIRYTQAILKQPFILNSYLKEP